MHGPGDVRFFRLVAPVYDLMMPRARRDDLLAGIDRADRDVERVLDLGGGTGRASVALRGRSPDGVAADSTSDGIEPIVVDLTHAMLVKARDRGLEGVLGDAGRLPFADDAVDAIVVVDALHHFPDQDLALQEARRLLRPGGVLVVREFDPRHPVGWLLAAGERLLAMDSTFLPPDLLARQLREVGLEPDVIDRGFGYTVVGIVPEG